MEQIYVTAPQTPSSFDEALLSGCCLRAVPRQKRFVILDAAGRRQAFEDVAQPGIGLLPVGLGGFDQAVDLRAGRRTFGYVAEQPVLAPDDERADGVLGAVVVDRQLPALDVAHQ